jgi:hypothetical protein
MPTRWLLVPLLAAALTPAFAASLLPLAPSGAILTLEASADAGFPPALAEALGALPWGEGGDTLAQLLAVFGNGSGDPFSEVMGDLEEGLWELLDACPAAEVLWEIDDPFAVIAEGMVTLSLDPMNPVPTVAFLARASDPAAVASVQDALTSCFGGPVFSQDGVALTVLFDGGDLPLIVGRLDDLFFAATDPNVARGIVRRALGSPEPALGDTALGAALARLAPGGLGIGVDVAAIAGFAPFLAMMVPPDLAPLIDRVTAAVSTLGVVAGRVGWQDGGLTLESIHTWPEPAPDAALGALIGHQRAAPALPALPAGGVAAASAVFPILDVIDYVDGWLLDLTPLTGMPLDLRSLFAELLGIDLDALLLGWIGDTFTMTQLDTLGTDVRPWLQGPATILAIDLRDPAAAELGVPLLGATLLEALIGVDALLANPFMNPLGSDGAAVADLLSTDVVTTRSRVAGVDVDRIRAGASLDVGVALHGGQLLIGSPWRALTMHLEHEAAGGALRDDAAWRAAVASVPAGARDASLSDVAALAAGLADLAEAGAQPLAGLLALAAAEAERSSDVGYDDWSGGGWGAWDDTTLTMPSWDMLPSDFDPAAVVAEALFVETYLEAELTSDAPHLPFVLFGVVEGATIEIEMFDLDGWLDTYLYVYDGATGEVLFSNDDAPGTDRSFIAFIAEAGVAYHVLASSYGGWGSGVFSLSVRERGAFGMDDGYDDMDDVTVIVPAPTFAELLAMTDLLAEALRIVADHAGIATVITTVEGDAAITRMLIPFR